MNGFEEKKIISDLPVDCKFCGVTIRQSRNLRRHIDQMHSKMESKSKNARKKSGKPVLTNREAGTRIDEKDTGAPSSPLITEFSQDSFSQLTEEILSYSTGSESEENSFPKTITLSSTSVNTTGSLEKLDRNELCFQLSTKSGNSGTNSSHTSSGVNPNSSVGEQFACSHLDDSCNVNDIALKELESQLFSACFRSTENI